MLFSWGALGVLGERARCRLVVRGAVLLVRRSGAVLGKQCSGLPRPPAFVPLVCER
ncbi:hypothetical protein GCM10007338_04720 [Corynebacterium pelargi]|nr:hypothetical protein GCM10007338_04720 [Corynebacterium pelargi]